jgi:membrane protease YdiL (CAAX protease family)
MPRRAFASLSRQYPIITFFVLAFGFAWMVWIPAGFMEAPAVFVLLGAFAPTGAGLLVTAALEGRSGVRALLRSLTRFRVPPRLYAIAILGPTAVALLAAGSYVLVGGSISPLADLPARYGLAPDQVGWAFALLPAVFLASFIGGPIAEELGWRGFAQPRLQAHIGAGPAGLVIGALWSLWHLPLIALYPAATAHIPLLFYLPLVTAFGVFFAWLYVGAAACCSPLCSMQRSILPSVETASSCSPKPAVSWPSSP